jgi:hypothetical protein
MAPASNPRHPARPQCLPKPPRVTVQHRVKDSDIAIKSRRDELRDARFTVRIALG